MKKKLKKPSIRTINHRDGGMSFYAEGGEFDFVRNQGQKPQIQNQNEEIIMGSETVLSPELWEKRIRDVESKIGNPSTWTMDSYNQLQNTLNDYKNWRENTKEGKAVYDSHNEPNEYVVPLPEHLKTYANGGQTLDRFKRRLMNRYPGMQGVYGSEGQNLNIIKDPNYAAADYGFGNIEFIQPGNGVVNYSDDYQYQSPTPDKYTAVYNPKGANRGDVFLDMMHGMRNDPQYMKLLDAFTQNVKNARGEDMKYFYDQEAKNGYTDGQEQWDNNYIDGQLRAQLAKGTLGMFSHGRKDYRQERKFDTPEMRQAAQDIRNYLKGRYENGGELPMYATQGQVGPSLFPAPSLGFQNSVQNFVAKEDAKKKAIIKEQEELQKQTKNKKVIATLQPNYNNAFHTDTTGPYGNGYTQEQQRYFESKNIPTHLWDSSKEKKQWDAEKKKREEEAIVQRRKDIQKQAIKDLEEGQFNNTLARAENLTNAFRFFPEDADNFFDDYINPFQMLGSMAGNLQSNFAKDAGPINKWKLALDIASPLAVGAFAGLGVQNNKQFINNIVNPIAGFNPLESIGKKAKKGLLNFIDRKLGEDTPVFQFKRQIGRDIDPGDIRTVVETNKKQVLKNPSGFTKAIGSGAEEFESVIQSRINDLTSEEGYKRLVNQEKEYLQSIKYKGKLSLDEQAAINAGARINELKNVVVSNRLAKDFFKTNRMKGEGLDKIIDQKLLYNNAYYSPSNVSDDLYKPFGYEPTFGINLEKFPQLGGKIIPGELGIGYTNLGNVPIMHHEIAHALQRNRSMPIDTELSFITPKSKLNSTDAEAYRYFMKGSKGHEPSAFANELRASMLQRGLIKNIYDPITPELLQKAHSSFMQKPIAKYQKLGKSTPGGFLTGHRIIDFMEPSISNFNILSQIMNKLPAAAPLGIGLGAALYNSRNPSNKPQNEFGGGIELSNRIFEEGGEYELTNEEIQNLKNQGYDIELL